jgi:elongator complex protein 3
MVLKRLAEQNISCKCIRCREAGLSQKYDMSSPLELSRQNYQSSDGSEVFLSYIDSHDSIYGFLRLRQPSKNAHRKEISQKTCIVRELHVYGKSVKVGEKNKNDIQHSGFGKKLIQEAEKIAKEEFDSNKLLIISGVGTREYYQKLGYSLFGPYMAKELA